MCDTCVRIFHAQSLGRDSTYKVTHCSLCQTPVQLAVRLVPKTASYRTVTFDGGGVRGIVSLELFKALSLARRLPYPIQDDFDLAVGTSSGMKNITVSFVGTLADPRIVGGLIVLLMFLEGRDVHFCLSTFNTLATRVFQPQRFSKVPMCGWLCEFLKAVMANGRYDVTTMEHCLKRVYGKRQRLFDSDQTGSSGIKVAVTALSTSNGQLCLMTNYNGGPRLEDPGLAPLITTIVS
ncbi:Acyl transferase/acyl hydrolase/lysophospholipase [Macrophomina phaseolina MS6]|uniref:Acyl transferase/acyl hydrolase/lysophospholipase n=1 Tax=Macrophomina phaseolina (strain MS6) TaxID=1126212 RepID=K2QH95_MACPH|nr:Acyl transferase/acyl hydrolase/lysophospholipase [Macrophomina phaseolina MS6]